MKIGELSSRTGCPVGTIRFYESKGLLGPARRGPGNQRIYGTADLERLRYIMDCRANGMKLECIERFIEFQKDPSLGTPWLLERVDDYLDLLEKNMASLRKLRQHLTGVRASLVESIRAAEERKAGEEPADSGT
ncbi:MerR family transcriptional regulator [Sutterella sp.]|uniref:MerR family transcriptional regulator n=1 Tax=Sutterella sp. TaxID=1981025 RepID=UPI0026E03848|nr:MerR family transcriptional regulator [Sutterella sp.]MDO5532723.1 MerR family transcriptional regulator [Sutterella sp.]